MIRLERLARSDTARIAHLDLPPQQRFWAGQPSEILPDPGPFDCYAICQEERIVGFFRIDRDYACGHPFARPGELGLRAFMIAATDQGRSLGTAAMRALAPGTRLARTRP